MKNKSILLFSAMSLMFFGFQFSKNGIDKMYMPSNSGGAGAGKTGAPGESNCTACHAGSAITDVNGVNVLAVLDGNDPVTSYVPGMTYTVRLKMTLPTDKKGFQATALQDASNDMAGDFAAGPNTLINSANGREYANHTSTSNSGAVPGWDWSWTAPASSTGDVTFYVASNLANNNGANTGDEIWLSEHSISESPSASLVDLTQSSLNNVSFVPGKNEVFISLNTFENEEILFSLIDLKGKTAYKTNLGSVDSGTNTFNVGIPSDLKTGSFIVQLEINNQQLTKLIQVVR
ncbi:MAG: hypothetical protein HOH34_03015 [Flavobacteriales bacterium]|mgnify:FL=1|jgi:hypothetical protein|nr:hypothetical protein [Flavobacteriales bacterium]MDA8910242.1 Reeler domain-containing protein [Crocinitomicaceae bacterium]MDC0460576.1 Reeler domain-containing protein [Crocinitomicaceae bacterium]